ncbi:MAG: prolipoprotein diacylglyceryl transferase [Chloroflexales bacterium]|nr:prolipoprotein diacylglyceryl transferase [Chloroflexales bacterium]
MALHPPTDPYLFYQLFGIPFLTVHWYGVIIMSGAALAAWMVARRAKSLGYDPEHVWNTLMVALVVSIICARAYYVAFEWPRFAGRPFLEIIDPRTGGIAIHGAIFGAIIAAIGYARFNKLPILRWLDICVPGLLLGQAVGRWGNFFNQEAYGRPTTLGFGVDIDDNYRLPPYNDLQTYPPGTLFHPTFLYESLWNFAGVALLLWLDRHFGTGAPASRRWLRPGDLLAIYAIYYSVGRFWVEGLRTDSLCTNGVGGDCSGALRTAQLVSLVLIGVGAAAIAYNHARRPPPALTPSTSDNFPIPPKVVADLEQPATASE